MKPMCLRLLVHTMIVCAMMGSGVSAACAKPKIYVTWEVSGSAGSPGGVTYTPVIVGVGDDGTSAFPQRFPNQGRKGSGGKMHESETGKVKSPDGKTACTIPPIAFKIPPKTNTWPVWVSPKLTTEQQTWFREAIMAINNRLEASGSSFRLARVLEANDARTMVQPTGNLYRLPVGMPAGTFVLPDRNGTIIRSTVAVADDITSAELPPTAEHELGHALGLGHVTQVDSAFPSRMYEKIGDFAGGMDPCFIAAINFNAKGSK